MQSIFWTIQVTLLYRIFQFMRLVVLTPLRIMRLVVSTPLRMYSTQVSFSNKIASNFAQKEHQRQNQHRQCVAEAEAAMIARQQHADHRHEQYIANARWCEHLQTRVPAGAGVSEEVSSLDCYNIARDPTTHLMNNKPQCNKSGAHQSLSENSLGKEPHVRAENVSEEVSFFRLLLY